MAGGRARGGGVAFGAAWMSALDRAERDEAPARAGSPGGGFAAARRDARPGGGALGASKQIFKGGRCVAAPRERLRWRSRARGASPVPVAPPLSPKRTHRAHDLHPQHMRMHTRPRARVQ